MLAVVADLVAFVEKADHVDGLFEHLQPHADRGPGVTQDVLVEGLAAAHAQDEPAVQLNRRGGRRLGDDRWVDPHCRAGDGGADGKRCRLRQRTDHPQTKALWPCSSFQGWK